MNKYLVLVPVIFLLFLTLVTQSYAQTLTQQDNKAKREINSALSKAVNNHYSQYEQINATIGNKTFIIYNKGPILLPPVPPVTNETKPPVTNETEPKIEICGDGIDNNDNGLVDENCPVTPPPVVDKPSTDVNNTKILRVCTIGDVDNNSGLDKQISLMKKYNCDTFVLPGDYAYTNGPSVLNKITNADFNHVAVVCGNHDSCTDAQKYMKMNATYGQVNIGDKISFYLINANTKFGCSDQQFTDIKKQLSSSDAWYNVPVVHQPFVTVKSDHGPNGQFNCWNPLFAANGVTTVLQAHNHNYQRINVNGVNYMVVGTGTHDTGSAMYPCSSQSWNNFAGKCITGVNGLTILDFRIDSPAQAHVDGWFIDSSGNVKDKW
jgi:predicted phosphodiesterase